MHSSPDWIIAGASAIVIILAIRGFNLLVADRTRVQSAWADVDVQLKRRHDLIPNLVEAVRGYMQHESSVLESVTSARAEAVATPSTDVSKRSAAEAALSGAVTKLFAVAERYPQLRGVESVQLLQEQLTSTENRIAYARQFYNDEVLKYNTARATFPRNVLAGLFGFMPAKMFAATDSDRAVPVAAI
jgi:LemA protein